MSAIMFSRLVEGEKTSRKSQKERSRTHEIVHPQQQANRLRRELDSRCRNEQRLKNVLLEDVGDDSLIRGESESESETKSERSA